MMRSTSSTALGPSLTICWAASIAAWKLGKLTTPSTRARGSGASLQGQVLGESQRAFRADQQMRQIHAAVGGVGPLILVVENVEIVAAHPAQHLGPLGFDLAAMAERQIAHEIGDLRGASVQASRPGRTQASSPSDRKAVAPSTLCTMLP